MVHEQVGKEFPDMRQNEREIKFIRIGEAVITAGWPKGELTLNRSLVYFYSQGTRSGIGVLWVICWLDEARILSRGWVRQILFPCGVERETGYATQEDLKFVNSYSMGVGGKDTKGLVFLFLRSKALLGFICSFILGSPQFINIKIASNLISYIIISLKGRRYWNTRTSL